MISIEPLAPDHFPIVARWMSVPAINVWLTSEWRGRAVEPSILAIACRNKRNRMYLVKSAGTPVGVVGLADMDLDDKTAMVWYLLGESGLSGKGVTSEAVRQICAAGFGEMGLRSIYAWIMEPNIGSRRVLERAGFREAGRLRRAANHGGDVVDRIYFDRIAGE